MWSPGRKPLIHPDQALDFAAGWLQMLSFLAAAIFSVASVVYAKESPCAV
jgi:hypothetical protein